MPNSALDMAEARENPSKKRKLDLNEDGGRNESFIKKEDHVEDGANGHMENVKMVPTEDDEVSQDESEEDHQSVSATEGKHDTTHPEPLSKNQLKKLRKKMEWEARKDDRRAKRKEKNKERKQRRREGREPTMHDSLPKPKNLPRPEPTFVRKHTLMPITFVVDCGFDDLMVEKEMISLGSQLTRCYSDNKTAPYRAHLVFSSFGGHLKERFETVLANTHLGWKGVTFSENDYVAAAEVSHPIMCGTDGGQLAGAFSKLNKRESISAGAKGMAKPGGNDSTDAESGNKTLLTVQDVSSTEPAPQGGASEATNTDQAPNSELSLKPNVPSSPKIVYLTSDSPYTLEKLSPYTTYIIGGLVDKNRYKGICYKQACERNIPTAKLPIGQYMEMQSRSILATNHVVEIMIRWLEHGDWGKAFLRVIPKRKAARLRGRASNDNGEAEDQEEDAENDQSIDDDAGEHGE